MASAVPPVEVPLARPPSAVSSGVGIVGLIGLATWLAISRYYGFSGPNAALVNIAACGLPMMLWSIIVDKVHRNPTTGIDWEAPPKTLAETRDISLAKLAGLWTTWAVIGAMYGVFRYYWSGNYAFAMHCLGVAAPILLIASPLYVLWLDRRLITPRDGSWALGAWLTGRASPDWPAIAGHARSWAVKAFFLAFMLSIVPGGFYDVVSRPWINIMANPVTVANYLISVMFMIDVAVATVGYILTMRPLDAHIRSANPFAQAWVAALICYPPFVLMGGGGPLDYHPGTMDWSYWFAAHPMMLALWGAVLVALTALYAWATVAFGLRFSNLTHRGILTHGPYAWTRHPAYLSKNAFWWLSTMPFLITTQVLADAIRNTILLSAVSVIYLWRARTEERHLGDDPIYRDYCRWIDQRHDNWFRRVMRRRAA